MTPRGSSSGRLGWCSALIGALSLSLSACATNQEAASARQVALKRLKCPADELVIELNRQTPKVREWVVACEFTYTRVHCTDQNCYQAGPRPVCREGMPCFEEDPVTLGWRVKEARN